MLRRLGLFLVWSTSCLGVLMIVVTVTPLVSWWTARLAGPWNDPSGDTLIVFGGETQSDGMIGLASYWRTVYAVRAWHEGTFQRMILCGGPPNRPVAEAMRQFVVSQGVDPSRVVVDLESGSTHENAIAAKRLAGDAQVVLLTSDYHMFRAIRAARKAGLAATPRPVPDSLKLAVNWQSRWAAFIGLVVESSKIAYYWARGWI